MRAGLPSIGAQFGSACLCCQQADQACCLQEVETLQGQLDSWKNHKCASTPPPGACPACPDKQRQLDSQQSKLRQLESDHASELRKQDRQVQDLQAQLQSFSGLQQVHTTPMHICRMSFTVSIR